MNDQDEVFGVVKAAFSGIDLSESVDDVISRGRRVRRRRRVLGGLVTVGVAGVGGLAALVSVVPAAPPAQRVERASTVSPTSTGRPRVDIDLAAWSVHSNPDSTVTITIRELKDPDKLRAVLAEAGIPAVVQVLPADAGFCMTKHGLMSSVVPQPPGLLHPQRTNNGFATIIRPSAMPPGSVLSFSLHEPKEPTGNGPFVEVMLLSKRVPLATCR